MNTKIKTVDYDGVQYSVSPNEMVWRPSTYAVVIKDGSLLLTKQRGTMHLPGGGVEFGETFEETVIREVKEETDVIVTTPHLLCAIMSFFTYFNETEKQYIHTQAPILFYVCKYTGGILSMDGFEDSEKIVGDMPEWIPLSKLDDVESSSTYEWKSIVRRYAASL